MNNLERVKLLTKNICNKDIVKKNESVFTQDMKCIYYDNNYIEVLHEIGHYLASDKTKRNLSNLGLLTNEEIDLCEINGDIHNERYVRVHYEECVAMNLTHLLFHNHFENYTECEKSYVEYILGESSRISKIMNFNEDEIQAKANSIFQECHLNLKRC